ncbi:hypothetical protein HMI54_005154 [Coelomomyces lativittatus]|nr:hypothetical protein HMI54_005154 [Coelomomyces lativittatus]
MNEPDEVVGIAVAVVAAAAAVVVVAVAVTVVAVVVTVDVVDVDVAVADADAVVAVVDAVVVVGDGEFVEKLLEELLRARLRVGSVVLEGAGNETNEEDGGALWEDVEEWMDELEVEDDEELKEGGCNGSDSETLLLEVLEVEEDKEEEEEEEEEEGGAGAGCGGAGNEVVFKLGLEEAKFVDKAVLDEVAEEVDKFR